MKFKKRHREVHKARPAKLHPKHVQRSTKPVSVTFMKNTREHIFVSMVRVLLYFLPFTYETLDLSIPPEHL